MTQTKTNLDREDFSAGEVLVGLTQSELDVLRQLAHHIRWDGHVDSKVGRDKLVAKGLAWHTHGWQGLTAEGCVVALEDGTLPS